MEKEKALLISRLIDLIESEGSAFGIDVRSVHKSDNDILIITDLYTWCLSIRPIQ